MPERQDIERIFLDNLGWIERVVASLCRRHGVVGDDADDFASWAKLRLVQDDYAVLRKFRGESTITTYLTVVLAMLFREYRVQRWGRWRPSAAAQQRGRVAVRLETLVYRDGYRLDQAAEVLRTADECDLSNRELADLLAALPPRVSSRPVEVGPEPLARLQAAASSAGLIEANEEEERRRKAHKGLALALASLPAEDQLILRMRFWKDMSVAEISRGLGLPQKPLYRRINRSLLELRSALEAAGVSRDQVRTIIAELESS